MSNQWVLRVRSCASYFCGYGLAASIFSGNWWWMLWWLALPIVATVEAIIEERERSK